MNTIDSNFHGRLRSKISSPTNWVDLINLPNERMAFIYQRLSTHDQIKKSIYSIKAQDALVDLAKEDGYTDEQIHIESRDLGISGTKGREDRPGLAYLIERVEAGLVEAVYVVHISRLYRDQTLINAFSLGELFKEYNIIIITPQMRLNLKDKMHMRLFRMEVERAADELELMSHRLLGAKNLKAKAGYYAGELVAPGYVVDERKELENGKPNPNYHNYQIYKPHAEVVKVIFTQLLLPKMTPTRTVRYCKEKDIAFSPLPPEFRTKANLKGLSRVECNPDGSQPVTPSRVRSIATNPAYIGWKIWEGEVVNKNAYPPIIDEATFWAVQERFTKKQSRPKKGFDPLPLAGLLYCGNHDIRRQMSYANKKPVHLSYYECYDTTLVSFCTDICAHILDEPISEAVVSQIALPGLAEQILSKLTSEYEQAKEQAASYRREAKRLETEIENLRTNLAMGVLSTTQIAWIDEQILRRLTRIKELADLEKQPIGAIGQPLPGQADIELVEAFLDNIGENWASQPNGLKNAFLRLLLNKVVIFHSPATVRVKLFWRVGLEQELLIHKPRTEARPKWTETELEILRQHYRTTSRDDLLTMLPNREWTAIICKACTMNLSREVKEKSYGRHYTPEEDEIVRQYYAGEINKDEAKALLGRTTDSIWNRASKLGLTKLKSAATWEWINKGGIPENDSSS